ncbi:glycosyltransferase [Pseudolysinimonas sp.]|uniref:glycosyltransferase n=1 Tax=Pseudolysinimonas sp. TaxID=2680009 RepID=UPI00286CECD9|nr:glycosyltransferase [Pseudolysinimonas sp.]
MRVLHVTEALGGGVQSAIANYIDHLPEIEHAVYSRARDGQSTYSWSGPVAHERYEGGLAGFFVRLVRKVQQERPDIVHLHSSFAGAARAVLPPGTAVVYSPHCYATERRDLGAMRRAGFAAIEWLLARRTRAVVAVSPREAELSRRLSARVPVVVALNPAPFAAPAARAPAADPAEVVMVGRISPQKDPGLFAAVAASTRDAPWRYVWIGDGDPDARRELLRAGVEVTGWTPPDKAAQRVAGARLYLHSAAWEGGPLSTIEAATLSTPVLSRDIPSMRSLGYELAGERPAQLAGAIARFFSEPAYAAHVAQRTTAVAVASSPSAMTAAVRDAYGKAFAIGLARVPS